MVRGTGAGDCRGVGVLDSPAANRHPMLWVSQHLVGFIGHSLPEQSSGRNRPIGGHDAEEPSELIKHSINKDHKAYT